MGTRRIGRLAGPLLGVVLLVAVLTQAGAQPAAETTPPASAPSALPAGSPSDLPAGPPDAPRFLLEGVRVEPPGGEAEFLVRRNLHLHPGQMVDAATLVQTRQYLAATRLFAELDLYTTRGSRFGAVIAVVVARTSHRLRVEIGAGRDPGRGWYWTVLGLRRQGLFGRGGVAQVSYRIARRSAGLYADLDIPSLIAREADLLVNLSAYRDTWTIRQGDSTHFQPIDGGRFRIGARRWLADDFSATLWGGVAQTHPRRTVQGEHGHPKIPAAGLVSVYQDDLRLGEAQLDLLRNGRDRMRPWQNGSWAQWILRGSVLREGRGFWGSELDTRLAVPVAGTRVAAFRFRAAYASADTPYFLRPVVGGVGSLRGFSEGERQVLMNLVHNAQTATAGRENPCLRLATLAAGEHVVLEVEDNGPGIPAADRDRVFEPYLSETAGGLGLGLALVKNIVLAHGGSARVEEGRWGGACIRVELPRNPEPEA